MSEAEQGKVAIGPCISFYRDLVKTPEISYHGLET